MSDRHRLAEFVRCRGLASVLIGALLLVLVVASVTYLVQADRPWSGRAADRAEAGKDLRAEDYAQIYGWWAALINTVLLGGALATFGWWGKRSTARIPTADPGAAKRRFPTWFWVALGATVLVAGIWRAPRLDHSFWNDEEYAFRRYTWGEYDRADPVGKSGKLVFDGVGSADRLFLNKSGNNHVLHTLEATAGLAIWEWWISPVQPDFSEAAARLFPFLASFATVALAGILGAMAGGPVTGIGAAMLLALSPWHIRYSVEARGYSTMLLGILLAIVCLVRALETGRWRWWLGFGAAQAAFLLSFAGAVYVAVGMNGVALVCLGSRVLKNSLPVREAARWGVVTALSAAAVIPVLLHSMPQVMAYRSETAETRAIELDFGWVRDYWTHLVAGVPPVVPRPEVALGTGVDEMARAAGWTAPAINYGVPLLALLGSVLLVVRGGLGGRLVVGSLWAAALLSYLHNSIGHTEMYGWYLVYTAPALAISLAAFGTIRSGRWIGVSAVGCIVVGYAWLTWTPRQLMATVERQPMATVAERVRGRSHSFLNPDDGGVLTGTFGVSDRQIQTYDPRVEILESRADLSSLAARAGAQDKALYVYFCGRPETAGRNPDILALIDEPTVFEKVADVPGFEAYFSYEIFRLKKP
ncbi:hypothetical protein BH23VER1_BH23VER1_19470 [soil metagenome]